MHKFNKNILKKYDIRGSWGKDLTSDDSYYLGLSFAKVLQMQNLSGDVYIGYDGRHSSPKLKEKLIEALLNSGVNVVEVGLVPTPALYFACHFFDSAIAGIMVTGSHNPPEDNGFKMLINKKALYGDSILELAKIAESGDFIANKSRGKHTQKFIAKTYIEEILSINLNLKSLQKPNMKNNADLKIAWDPGNGAASDMITELIKYLPGTHFVINNVIDGNFPSHSPDPTVPSNLKELSGLVKKNVCDIGLAFDGDGDRIIALDQLGNILYGDQLLMIFAHDFLKRQKEAKIVCDIKTSAVVLNKIKEWGGDPVIWKTGHSLIKAKMLEEKSLLAGEASGHLFFGENYYGFDDALFAAVKLILILCEQSNPLVYLNSFPRPIATDEIRIFHSKPHDVVKEIKSFLQTSDEKYNNIDGIKMQDSNGSWLIRASNTQNCIVVKAESADEKKLLYLRKDLVDILSKVGINIALKNLSVSHNV